MLIYLLSIIFYIYVFFNGLDEKNRKGKFLTIAGLVVAGYNIYQIFSGNLSHSFFLNFLLTLLPGAFFLFSLLFVFGSTPQDTSSQNNAKKESDEPVKPTFDVDITDNEITGLSKTHIDNVTEIPDEDMDDLEPIHYENAKIQGFGSCDVHETNEYIKIIMRSEGKEYEFYVKDSNVVAYRVEGMTKPQTY